MVLHQVRLTFGQMYPAPEASSGQEWYYFRSAWHLVSLWVRLTFGQMYLVSPEASSGQVWYYFWSGWTLVRCTHYLLMPPSPQPPTHCSLPQQSHLVPRVVLCQVRLTCGQMIPQMHLVAKCGTTLGQADLWSNVPLTSTTPPTPSRGSSGQGWYYCGSIWHLVNLLVRLTFGLMYPPTPHSRGI